MPDNPDTAAAARLHELIMGFRATQMIYVAARLGLADELARGPQSAQALAARVGAAPQPLYRLLRALASLGIFIENDDGAFALTPLAELLRQDAPGSLKSTALLYGDAVFWGAYGQMLHSVRTGEPGFDRQHGAPLYAYLATHADTRALFQEGMSGFSQREIAAIRAAYDFSQFGTVVDVGGGQGALVVALLEAHPHLLGVILDRPDVAAGAQRLLGEAGLTPRARFVPGDFFQAVPREGDAYLLKSVIHNWDDAGAIAILKTCRAAMRADARLIVIERVVPGANVASEAKLFDINMLVVAGGQQRSADGHRAILQAAGFALTRIIPTDAPLSLIEARPA